MTLDKEVSHGKQLGDALVARVLELEAEAKRLRAELAAERRRCAEAVRSAPNGCALADNRAYVERFRHALLDVIEGPNVGIEPPRSGRLE